MKYSLAPAAVCHFLFVRLSDQRQPATTLRPCSKDNPQNTATELAVRCHKTFSSVELSGLPADKLERELLDPVFANRQPFLAPYWAGIKMIDFIYNNWPIIFLVSAVLIAWIFAKLVLGNEKMPYQKRSSLLTKSELAFYRALNEAVDGHWAIQSMVRMADLIRVAPKTPKFQSWQNRIHAKHIDFLLCDHGTMEAKLAVELDDKSHQRPDRITRDRFVNHALSDAGLPLLRIEVQEGYDASLLRKSINEQLD